MTTHPFEQFLLTAAREFKDGTVCFVGFHWPMVAARIARLLHAPNLVVVYENGIVEDGLTPELATSPSDLRVAEGAPVSGGSIEALYGWLGSGRVQHTVLEAPIVDRRGNVNTTVLGTYDDPKVRLPGSGGGTELGSLGRGLTLVCASSHRRSYPERVDYITSPGYLRASGQRRRLGYPDDRGPKILITPLGRFTLSDESGIEADAVHANVLWNDVREVFTWLPQSEPDDLRELPTPSHEELRAVRAVLEEAQRSLYRLPEGVGGK